MTNINELSRDDRSAIVWALSNNGIDMECIASIMLDGNWKYCDSDEELKEAIKEKYDEEFDTEGDFNEFVFYEDGIITLCFDPGYGYLIEDWTGNSENETESIGKARNVDTLSVELKKQIACQLDKQGFSEDEIAEIVFLPYEGYEWKYCEDGETLRRTVEEGYWANKIDNNRIITLYGDFYCAFLICFKMD